MKRLWLAVVLLGAGCGADGTRTAPLGAGGSGGSPGQPADPNALTPPAEVDGFQLAMKSTVPPGSEVWLCEVSTLPNHFWANVHRVQVKQNAGTHHLTLSLLSLFGDKKVAPGRYDCNDLYGDQSLMKDAIMIYGNQGSAEDTLELPPGIAATLPPDLQVLHEIHYVNATTAPVELYSYVNAYTIPDEQVKAGVYGGSVRDEHIEIPASGEHTEWSRCVMTEDVDILFLAAHQHSLGTEFTIAPFDGTSVGEVFYRNLDWHVPKITQYAAPMKLKKGQGFEWRCTWRNPADHPVEYGLRAVDEMCNLAVVFTPFSLTARCNVVASSDGVLWRPEGS